MACFVKKEKDTGLIPDILYKKDWCRGTESNCRHGDFQTNIFKIENWFNFNQLILFHFFNQLLVSFVTIWKNLTLTSEYGMFLQNVHNSKLMSSISGFRAADIIRVTQAFETPRYLATSAPE